MSANQIQVGNVGMLFDITVTNQDGEPVDIGPATTKQLWFERPDGSMLKVDGFLVTDGLDGRLGYKIEEGDLSMDGLWRYQTYVIIGPDTLHSDIGKFRVFPNLPV